MPLSDHVKLIATCDKLQKTCKGIFANSDSVYPDAIPVHMQCCAQDNNPLWKSNEG